MKTIINFTGVHSASRIEAQLRTIPIHFLEWLYSGTRIQVLYEEVRAGNKGSTAIYLHDFHWHSYESVQHGVGLVNLAREEWGTDFQEVLARCAAFLKTQKIDSRQYQPIPRKTHAEQEQAKARKQQRALRLVANATPIGGTVAERYLRKRKIDTSALPSSALRQLGYVASCYHEQTDAQFPALVATVRDDEGAQVAAHRVYLTKNAQKALIEPQKSSLGSTKGASIHLTPARDTLIITEGLEDGLSVLLGVKDNRKYGVWCGIGATLTGIIIPKDTVGCVVLAVDNDPSGDAYIQELAPRLTREGFRVCVAVPTHGKDFNEMLCRYGRLFNPKLMEKYHA